MSAKVRQKVNGKKIFFAEWHSGIDRNGTLRSAAPAGEAGSVRQLSE
jgi:hypothetical protein